MVLANKIYYNGIGGTMNKFGFTLAEVFHPAGQAKRTAFTLAEVLITLGIIGVVAALTMPSLIQHHRKQVIETRLAKFYSNINQAMKLSEIENGPRQFWQKLDWQPVYDSEGNFTNSYTSNNIEEWFDKYFGKYIQTVKTERANTSEDQLKVYFPDGSLLLFSANSWLFYPEAKNFETMEKDDKSIDRLRKDCGKKYFTFGIYNFGIAPYGMNSSQTITEEEILNDNVIGCNKNASNERALCTLLIARNGWKIPKDYPLKF